MIADIYHSHKIVFEIIIQRRKAHGKKAYTIRIFGGFAFSCIYIFFSEI